MLTLFSLPGSHVFMLYIYIYFFFFFFGKGNPVIARTNLHVWRYMYYLIKKNEIIEHTSIFIFDLAIRHALFVSA